MKPRSFVPFFYIACIVLAAVSLGAPPALMWIAKKSITGALPGSHAAIKACRLWPPGTCTLSGVEIQRPGMYRIVIPSITAIPSVSGSIRIPDFQLDVNTDQGRLQATASLSLRQWGKEIREIALHVPSLQLAGVNVTNGSLLAAVGRSGEFAIEKLSAGKLVVSGISADTALDNNTIRLENLSVRVFGGSVSGNARVSLQAGMPYQVSIQVSRVDMAAAISEFRLTERLELSGRVEGAAGVQGSSAGYGLLSADITALAPGGVLNIRDQAVIDMIAERSGQARGLISKSFTDYQYDQAHALLYTRDNKLILDIQFQGEGGKRTLQVIVNDFSVQGGGL